MAPPPNVSFGNMSEAFTPDLKVAKMFIDNEFVESGNQYANVNPCQEESTCDVFQAGDEQVDRAVGAARKAFQIGSEWRTMDASARGNLMLKLADLMDQNKEYLASKN